MESKKLGFARALNFGQERVLHQQVRHLFTTLVLLCASAVSADEGLLSARAALDGWRLTEAAALLSKAPSPSDAVEHAVLRARLELLRSDYEAAAARLEPILRDHPEASEARVVRGRALLALGRTTEAFEVLDALADAYEKDTLTTVRGLIDLAIALRLTGSFKEANRIFGEALALAPNELEARVGQADLLLEKYNFQDSDLLYREVLAVQPRHAQALLGAARAAILSDQAYGEATELVTSLLATAPECVPCMNILALNELQAERAGAAVALSNKSLELAPRDGEALGLLAAAQFLLDDRAGLAATEKRALKTNPKAAAFYVTIAQHASRVHRYDEAAALLEKALVLEPDNADALAALGWSWSTRGEDTKAKLLLKKAFSADPYNVRTYNLLTHFYDDLDANFEWVEAGPARLRVNRNEKPVLERYVPRLVKEAHAYFSKKYGLKPAPPLNIELFADAQTFSVRSTGLPSLSAHGICFGHVITALSPSAGNFNWAEVLWHELAHVFHLQLSRGRVPRWFTEGMAVFESLEGRPSWQRNQDPELRAALRAHTLRGIVEFNLAFTQARSQEDLVLAYYQASRLVQFLQGEWGFPRLKKMLEAWGKQKQTPEVVKEVLGVDPAELDRRFFAWLQRDLSYLDAVEADPSVRLAAELRARGEHAAAARHLEQAVKLNPRDFRGYERLVDALEAAGDGAGAFAWRARQAEVDQMNAPLAIALLEGAERARASREEVLRWGELAVHVAPFNRRAHAAFAQAARAVGADEQARFEAETLSLLETAQPPRSP